jgi:putative transposase
MGYPSETHIKPGRNDTREKPGMCLAASVGPSVNQERAVETLLARRDRLVDFGIDEPLLIQSDGGSDFTSVRFQSCCEELGQWVRCRVNQVGGMGILERLNRTFKYESVFRDEIETSGQLSAHLSEFQRWYNKSDSTVASIIKRLSRLYYRRLQP